MYEERESPFATARASAAGPLQREAWVRGALEAAEGIGAWVWDGNNGRLRMDPACAALHGILAEGTITVDLATALYQVAGRDRARVETALHAASQAGSVLLCEYETLGADGRIRRVLLRGIAAGTEAGSRHGLHGIAIDVTPQLLAPTPLQEDLAHFKAIADSIDQMIWSSRPDGFHDYYNNRWYEYTGVPLGSTDGEAWSGMFHPEDQMQAWTLWRHCLTTGAPYQIEYRLRHRSGQYRWVIGRAQCVRDAEGRILRWYGTCTDIHDLKQAQTERELVSQELSHRIKNIFSVVSSLVSLSARGQPEARAFAETLQARIGALAVAHEYVRPHSRASKQPDEDQTVHGLFATLTAPYATRDGERIIVVGADQFVGPHAATALALIVHELCTNAVKYGALSREGGRVSIRTSRSGEVYRLVWQEEGGPEIEARPERRGFGTVLSERVIRAQLQATVEQDWRPEGLVFGISIPIERLAG